MQDLEWVGIAFSLEGENIVIILMSVDGPSKKLEFPIAFLFLFLDGLIA